MNSIRSILVHVDGTARATARLQMAHRIARDHQAVLTALFAVAPRYLPFLPLAGGVPSMPMPADIDPEHRGHARELFEQSRIGGAPACSWDELHGGPVTSTFVQRALLEDLLVLGQRDPNDAAGFDVPVDFPEAVVIESGRPALIVPYTGAVSGTPETVLIAWKPTRESATALAAALPFLKRAQHVHAICASEHGVQSGHDQLAKLARYLHLHGIDEVREHLSHTEDAGNTLLSLAADIGAELIVMGCYGHSRARELVLGGASRTLLETMTVPVLMAH